MNKYKVRIYHATLWSYITKADEFVDYVFDSNESLEAFSKRIARDGFATLSGKKWILSVEKA